MTGPPGSGKTTLVASYVKSRRLRTLWYQVDEGDSDVATFFYYMSLARKRAGPHKRKTPPRFGPEHARNLSAFARVYFSDLFSRLKPPFAIVLDNCQEVPHGSNFHDIITEGIRQMPRGGWVALISRVAPPSQFAQLRAGNDMQILAWEALRLTLREAAGIARLRNKRSLAKKAIQEAHRKSDGWAAGLVLMLEQAEIEGSEPKGGAGSQAVFDYFAQEILERQDLEAQNIMLKTSMLGKISGRAAVELTGIAQASRVLADLNSRNYFTEKRGQTEPVYQYHPLFREFLVAQAKMRFSPAALSRLQRKVARLLVESGSIEDIEEAVGLLRASADWRTLARLIAEHASSLIAEARHHTLEEWLKALPSRLIERNGWLRYWLGA
ncbi:MAG: AAA family ATPase, partial [Deltaproteobacteria bacterium]|nr:AAA family ATPase [Deltaproteobacteria bacterium]